MQTFYQIMGIFSAGLILFILFQTIKGRPDLFNKVSLNKSLFTMGALGVGLIAFVTLLILIVRHS
jgi:hypothetical protein